MNKDDRKKLLNAGITMLRTSDYPKVVIKYFTKEESWATWMAFETKAERSRLVKRINENEPRMIFDE